MNLEPRIRLLAGLVPDGVMLAFYHRPWRAGVMCGALNRVLPAGLNEVEIARGHRRGLRFVLDLQLEKYLWLGTYEPCVCFTLERYLRRGDMAWDVGAFTGYHTLLMSRRVPPGCVLTLEPEPRNAERLRRNIVLNGVTNVEILLVARVRGAGRRSWSSTRHIHPKRGCRRPVERPARLGRWTTSSDRSHRPLW